MANAQEFIFWNSAFFIPLAVLIVYRYTIQGLGYSGLAMFAGVAEMIARTMVGFWFVPLWGYFGACLANPAAWLFACAFLIPACLANPAAWLFACAFLIPAFLSVMRRLQKEYTSAAN